MSSKNHIHKEFSGKHVVWFKESNQWIGFEPPAYEVFRLHVEGKNKKHITEHICKFYELSKVDGANFIDEIIEGIKTASTPRESASDNGSKTRDIVEQKIPDQDQESYSIRKYLIHDKTIEIYYGSKILEYYIHPPLQYLETLSDLKPDTSFHLFSSRSNHHLVSEHGQSTWTIDEIPKLKRRLSLLILNIIYKTSFNDWFSRVHASAITDEKQVFLLSSESGSGKSTLATLLQSRGCRVLSDDYVPLNRKDQLAYPVPAALSIKKGSFDVIKQYLPDFNPKLFDTYEYGHKDIRFLPPVAIKDNRYEPKPVSSIIFVKYKQDADYSFREINSFDALGKYHQEAWVDDTPENAQGFINWFEKLSFYELVYSNTEQALDTISSLFETRKPHAIL